MKGPLADVEGLRQLAEPLAAAWSARATGLTTAGRERATLRAFGVGGLDRAGRPLAGAVVDRWLKAGHDGLGGGIALPFAMAALEYDLGPHDLAMDVAGGAIDLELEARLLAEPDRRAAAELEVARLGRAALERIDANRTARRELLDVLGDAQRPWLGATVVEPSVRSAGAEAAALVRAGADLIRVAVPTGRELVARLLDLGLEPPGPEFARGTSEDDAPAAPAGSQRGLAVLRTVLDELAAERRAYVRLATTAPALSAPEQAIVAAFERIDLVEADPLVEIVEAGVDPDRALADHAFAHRLHARSGTILMLGAGPLVVAPDLARGIPADPTTLAGRALALQLLSALLATRDGLPVTAILVGATPDWLLDEPDAAARGLAEIAVRRALLPEYSMTFAAPNPRQGADRTRVPARWASLVAAALPLAGRAALVLRSGPIERFGSVGAEHRAVAEVASAVAAGLRPGPAVLEGAAAAYAAGMVAAATDTIKRLADAGWRAILGEPIDGTPRGLGADAVADRTEAIDPLA